MLERGAARGVSTVGMKVQGVVCTRTSDLSRPARLRSAQTHQIYYHQQEVLKVTFFITQVSRRNEGLREVWKLKKPAHKRNHEHAVQQFKHKQRTRQFFNEVHSINIRKICLPEVRTPLSLVFWYLLPFITTAAHPSYRPLIKFKLNGLRSKLFRTPLIGGKRAPIFFLLSDLIDDWVGLLKMSKKSSQSKLSWRSPVNAGTVQIGCYF